MDNENREFDECAFAADVVEGLKTHKQLAAEYGITTGQVSRLIHGRGRSQVHGIIALIAAGQRRGVPLGLFRLQSRAVRALERVVEGEKESPAIAAAREVLSRTIADAAEPVQPEPSQPECPGLTAEDYANLAKLKGGPPDDGTTDE